ncbi:putative MYB family conidiophore development protein FlbD [Aspergillus stella-maris]|uniref:putative MYB family conidiophore development protein FlbD n=1 Tax=Aspergillus stella-maris TaxID=1810926 RepID=UPI003CCDEBDD
MAPTHRRGPWVPEEDQLLLQLVREQGPNNWVRISQHMHYRSPKQCRERYHQNLKSSLNRDPITPEEGLMIERMVSEMGRCWAEIARRLGNRSDNAVKNWWNGSMNRKRRGLHSVSSPQSLSRTSHSGRIEAPYHRASLGSSPILRSRFLSISHHHNHHDPRPLSSWTKSSAPSSRRESYSTSTTTSYSRQLTPIYTLPALNRPVDAPLTSPAFSDTSNAPSLDPPSMVSDHNSVSSSPRTLPSPQLLPLPVDTRYQYELPRPQISEDLSFSNFPGKTTGLFSSEPAKRWGPAEWVSPEEKIETNQHESRRDSRMGLDNLLN